MNHSQNEQLMARKAAATPRGVGVMAPFFAERAEEAGAYVLAETGGAKLLAGGGTLDGVTVFAYDLPTIVYSLVGFIGSLGIGSPRG